jgi:hypothetical protein
MGENQAGGHALLRSPGSWPPSAAEFGCVSFTLHPHPETSNLFPEFGGMSMVAKLILPDQPRAGKSTDRRRGGTVGGGRARRWHRGRGVPRRPPRSCPPPARGRDRTDTAHRLIVGGHDEVVLDLNRRAPGGAALRERPGCGARRHPPVPGTLRLTRLSRYRTPALTTEGETSASRPDTRSNICQRRSRPRCFEDHAGISSSALQGRAGGHCCVHEMRQEDRARTLPARKRGRQDPSGRRPTRRSFAGPARGYLSGSSAAAARAARRSETGIA